MHEASSRGWRWSRLLLDACFSTHKIVYRAALGHRVPPTQEMRSISYVRRTGTFRNKKNHHGGSCIEGLGGRWMLVACACLKMSVAAGMANTRRPSSTGNLRKIMACLSGNTRYKRSLYKKIEADKKHGVFERKKI